MNTMHANVVVKVVIATVIALYAAGCTKKPERVRDPNARFLTLGELAEDLAHDPKTFDAIVEKLGTNIGPLGDAQKRAMKSMFEARDWRGLDKQPETSLATLKSGLDLLASQRALSAAGAPPSNPITEPLGIPTNKPGPDGDPFVKDIGLGMQFGDRVDPAKRARFADGERLASLLDRLALRQIVVEYEGKHLATPVALVEALAADGHTVEVIDERFAANFGDLERNEKPIATPLWVTTGRKLDDGTTLALPVPHAQLKLVVRGPRVNTDVTLYPALDLANDGTGGTRFRADLTGDQPWCGGVTKRRYTGAQAIEAVRLMSELRRVVAERVADKKLPLDGYYELGVCTLAPALVEHAIHGGTTLWPITHDPAHWTGDTEIDRLARALPTDRDAAVVPDDARLKNSLPWAKLADVPFEHTRAALAKLGWLN